MASTFAIDGKLLKVKTGTNNNGEFLMVQIKAESPNPAKDNVMFFFFHKPEIVAKADQFQEGCNVVIKGEFRYWRFNKGTEKKPDWIDSVRFYAEEITRA